MRRTYWRGNAPTKDNYWFKFYGNGLAPRQHSCLTKTPRLKRSGAETTSMLLTVAARPGCLPGAIAPPASTYRWRLILSLLSSSLRQVLNFFIALSLSPTQRIIQACQPIEANGPQAEQSSRNLEDRQMPGSVIRHGENNQRVAAAGASRLWKVQT